MSFCPVCGQTLAWIEQYAQWYCQRCAQYRNVAPAPTAVAAAQTTAGGPPAPAQGGGLWYQGFYRLRKKAFAIADQYWIEDQAGRSLGYTKQKLFRIKEDVRVFTDESMRTELFRIQQQQIINVWGNFAILDSATNALLGFVRRKGLASTFVADEWEIYDPAQRLIGAIRESTGRGLARKWIPGGALIPETMTLELGGVPVAQFNQQFKVIGDIWEIHCAAVPANFDRRVLLGAAILMSVIERQHK